jgi:pimeloyl-ACP methyl ester carboxylesterase
MPDIVFLHGLESGPNGRKARWLAEHFDCVTPSLTTSDWDLATDQAAAAIASGAPRLVVGSSFGGAILLRLVQSGRWLGPSLFVAQAGQLLGLPATLPTGVRAILAHGDADDVVPIAGSEAVAASSPDARMVVVAGGDHRLNQVLEDGRMKAWVTDLLGSR